MLVNTRKYSCLRIGPRHNNRCLSVSLSTGDILWVDEIRYLGVFTVRSCRFRPKCSLEYTKKSFYRAANAIFAKTGRCASEEVTLHLVKSKCLPILLYGLEACSLTKSNLQSLDFVINRLFMKLFKTSNTDTVKCCQEYFNFDLPSVCGPSVCLNLKLSLVCISLVNELMCLRCYTVQPSLFVCS